MPEFLDRRRQIRALEVLHECESHAACRANGDERIAAKVAKYLEREEQRGQPHARAIVVGQVVEHRIDIGRHILGDAQLHEVAPHHESQALGHRVAVEGVAGVKLWQQVAGALNGAGDQLREERHEEGIGAKMALGGDVAAVHVDGVADGLKRIERDAHGQQDVKFGHR